MEVPQPLTLEALQAELAKFASGALRQELQQGLQEHLSGLRQQDVGKTRLWSPTLPAPNRGLTAPTLFQAKPPPPTKTEVEDVVRNLTEADELRQDKSKVRFSEGSCVSMMSLPGYVTAAASLSSESHGQGQGAARRSNSLDVPRGPNFDWDCVRKPAYLHSHTCAEELELLSKTKPRRAKTQEKEKKARLSVQSQKTATTATTAQMHDAAFDMRDEVDSEDYVGAAVSVALSLEVPRSCDSVSSHCSQRRMNLDSLVQHPAFGAVAGVAIFLNSAFIGIQTEYASRNVDDPSPRIFQLCDWFFCIVFSLELCVRILAARWRFFCSATKWWNMFDLLLVVMQIFDLSLQAMSLSQDSSSAAGGGYSSMRILRVLRLVRIVRLVRVLRLIGELRMMVLCILNSLRSLVWTVILLLLMIYVIAVYLTQLVCDHRADKFLRLGTEEGGEALVKFFGSLCRSILTLYQAMSGGISWNDAVVPLVNEITPLLGLVFSLYVAFALLAIMNVVTAVFVESALQSAKKDTDVYIVHSVHDAFMQADIDMDMCVSIHEFESLLETPQLRDTLRTIDIDKDSAIELFHLLDTDFQGRVSVRSIVETCIKSHGNARSIDLITLMSENRRQVFQWSSQMRGLERSVNRLLAAQSANADACLADGRPMAVTISGSVIE